MFAITLLGASAVRPNPGGACAGYLVSAGTRRYLVDCGFGVLSRVMGAGGIAGLEAILVSHAHPDHCADLVGVHMALRYAASERRDNPLPVFAGPDVIDTLRGLGTPFDQDLEAGTLSFSRLDPDGVNRLPDLAVRIAPTVHSVPCWAMRLEHGGRSLSYTGDTGPSDAVAALATGTDLLLSEATLLERAAPDTAGHLTAREAGALASAAGAGRLLLTHYYVENGPERLAAAAADTFAGPVAVGREGDTHDIHRG